PTDQGVVTVQTSDPDIELVARKNGAIVAIRNTKTDQTWYLNTHEYTLGLTEKPGGLVVELPDQEPFTLKREGKGVVTITRTWRVAAPAPGARVPLDSFRREEVPPEALAWVGQGDSRQAPPELVAVLGGARFRLLGENGQLAYSPDGKLLAVPSRSYVL